MHSLRCEHSTTDPKRCRCNDCHGAKHGIQAPGIVGEVARRRRVVPGLLYPELGADLKRARQQLAAYNEAMFAESGVRA